MPMTPALAAVLPVLRCPACGTGLEAGLGSGLGSGPQIRCARGHAYDVARQGYVNLATGKAGPGTGDSAEMVAARVRFLAAGHYQPIATSLAGVVHDVVAASTRAPIAELGGGTGYYLARVLDEQAGRSGICLDLSVPALRRAAKAHPRLAAVGCDVWQGIPLADGSVAVLLSVFAPKNGAEALRCLAPGGVLVTVTPGPEHLAQIADALGLIGIAPDKQERLEAQLTGFALTQESRVSFQAELPRDDVTDLVLMGPSARHMEPDDLARRVRALPEPVAVSVSVRVQAFQRREPPTGPRS